MGFRTISAVLLVVVVGLLGTALVQTADGSWRAAAVADLDSAGVAISFPDGSFLGEDALTGYQAAVLAGRLLQTIDAQSGCATEVPPEPTGLFADTPADHWSREALRRLSILELNEAFPNGFDGDALLSGFQTAKLMSEVLKVLDAQTACGRLDLQARVAELESELSTVRADINSGELRGPAGEAGPQGETGAAGPSGPPGTAGVKGDVGPAGLPGPVGAVGPIGEAGVAGLACWDVNRNGEGDLQEDLNLDGVYNALDCAGVAGPAGPQGPPGPAGPAGPRGADGSQGSSGPAGPVGPAGSQGSQGPPGPAGPEGPQGPQGPQGPEGPQGPAGPLGSFPSVSLAWLT